MNYGFSLSREIDMKKKKIEIERSPPCKWGTGPPSLFLRLLGNCFGFTEIYSSAVHYLREAFTPCSVVLWYYNSLFFFFLYI